MIRGLYMALAVTGCVPSDSKAPETAATEVSQQAQETGCNAADFTRYVGQPASVLELVDLPENVRVLHHNGVATTDHRPDRVNLEIGADGLISRVWCG